MLFTCSSCDGDDKRSQTVVIVVLLAELLLGQLHYGNHLLGQYLQQEDFQGACQLPCGECQEQPPACKSSSKAGQKEIGVRC